MKNFFRKVGFGIGPNEEVPSDPLNWALNQLDEIPKLAGVIFFIVPPSSTRTKSASLLDVVVAGASEFDVVNTAEESLASATVPDS